MNTRTLPQLVLCHVPVQQATSHDPLPTGSEQREEAALDRDAEGGPHHGQLPPPPRRFRGRAVVEAEDERKGQGASQAPDNVRDVLHNGVDHLQAVRARAEAPVQAAPLVPALATHARDAVGVPPSPAPAPAHDGTEDLICHGDSEETDDARGGGRRAGGMVRIG